MAYDYSKLMGRVIEKFGTQANFAAAMGLSERTISLKINSHVPWKDFEMERALKLLDVKPSQITEYFFRKKVQES